MEQNTLGPLWVTGEHPLLENRGRERGGLAQVQNLTDPQPARPGPGLGPKFDKGQFDGRPERCPKFDVLPSSLPVAAMASKSKLRCCVLTT